MGVEVKVGCDCGGGQSWHSRVKQMSDKSISCCFTLGLTYPALPLRVQNRLPQVIMAMTTTTTAPPSQSLYIRNLPEKLQKEDLRRELYMLFSTYGPVLDVTATKTRKMRGQAHVLFREMHSATQALRACQGFEMSGKQMVRTSMGRYRDWLNGVLMYCCRRRYHTRATGLIRLRS